MPANARSPSISAVSRQVVSPLPAGRSDSCGASSPSQVVSLTPSFRPASGSGALRQAASLAFSTRPALRLLAALALAVVTTLSVVAVLSQMNATTASQHSLMAASNSTQSAGATADQGTVTVTVRAPPKKEGRPTLEALEREGLWREGQALPLVAMQHCRCLPEGGADQGGDSSNCRPTSGGGIGVFGGEEEKRGRGEGKGVQARTRRKLLGGGGGGEDEDAAEVGGSGGGADEREGGNKTWHEKSGRSSSRHGNSQRRHDRGRDGGNSGSRAKSKGAEKSPGGSKNQRSASGPNMEEALVPQKADSVGQSFRARGSSQEKSSDRCAKGDATTEAVTQSEGAGGERIAAESLRGAVSSATAAGLAHLEAGSSTTGGSLGRLETGGGTSSSRTNLRRLRETSSNKEGPDKLEQHHRGATSVHETTARNHDSNSSTLPELLRFQEIYVPEARKPPPGSSKFLILAQTWEQLSQTRLHLLEALALARRTKRVLVLPQVAHSRLGHMLRQPFCLYFDTRRLRRATQWVTQRWLEQRLAEANRTVVSHSILILQDNPDQDCNKWAVNADAEPGSLFIRDAENDWEWSQAMEACRSEKGRCSRHELQLLKQYEPRMTCVIARGSNSTRESRQQQLMGALEGRRAKEAQLLVLHKTSHRYFLALENTLAVHGALRYAPYLHRIAQAFVERHLRPGFLALHWRTEWMALGALGEHHFSRDEAMQDCLQGLLQAAKCRVQALQGLLPDGQGCDPMLFAKKGAAATNSEGLNNATDRAPGMVQKLLQTALTYTTTPEPPKGNIFLACDMSRDAAYTSSAEEMTDQAARDRAKRAVRTLLEELQPVTWGDYEPEYAKLDRGVQGILDKLVAMKAGTFLGAPQECGGGHTFTLEIHSARLSRNLPSDTWEILRER